MNERGTDQGNSSYLSGGVIDHWYAPSLRGDHNTGLARWSEDDIVRFLKTGRNQHGVVYGSMAEAFNNSTQFLTDPDLRAIAHYLKDLPGDPNRDGKPWQYQPVGDALSMVKRTTDPGAQVYAAKCSFCHGSDGQGKGCGSRRLRAPRPRWPATMSHRSTSRSTDRPASSRPGCPMPIGCPPIASN
jgi:mono/diheme cytochrome c family protein